MNERIKQLAEQALKEFMDKHEYATVIVPDSLSQKFAELIVRECALTLYKSAVQDKQAGFAHEAKIMELAGDMIKQHFGVEE
jgi:ABC-type Zn uptake system ZnuABC Zn-binding protein ZnuA